MAEEQKQPPPEVIRQHSQPMIHEKIDYLYKVVIIGASGAGKTSFLDRITRNEFKYNTMYTTGVDFAIKTFHIDSKVIKVQIWDTAGQERFRSIAPAYYRGANGVLLLYDISDRASFDNADKWLRELRQHTSPGIIVMLIGNKSDLVNRRQISTEEARVYATQNNLHFLETSALDATGVNEAFIQVIREMYHYQIVQHLLNVSPSAAAVSSGQPLTFTSLSAGVKVTITPYDPKSEEKRNCC